MLLWVTLLVPDRLSIGIDLDIRIGKASNTRHRPKILKWLCDQLAAILSFAFPKYGLTYRILGSVLLHEEYHMVNILQGACNHGRACQERRNDDPDEKPHDESVNPDKAVEKNLYSRSGEYEEEKGRGFEKQK